MIAPLGFDALKGILHGQIAHLPDHRKLRDAPLGTFVLFFTQSSSFLEYQRRLQHTRAQ
jgi:hypothetical protein